MVCYEQTVVAFAMVFLLKSQNRPESASALWICARMAMT